MPTRPFTRRQAEQNAAFLAALRLTGNARLAARELGVHRATYTKRRAKHPAFAARWDEALAAAQARFAENENLPLPSRERAGRGGRAAGLDGPEREGARSPHTLIRLKNGRAQLRRVRPGTIGPAAETAFLLALAASANVRLSAAAAGFAHSSFYARAKRNRAFAREMRAALREGCERVQTELLAAGLGERDAWHPWRDNEPAAIPSMSAGQALQLLYLHQKGVELSWSSAHRRRRRGESDETHRLRLMTMWATEKRYEREDQAVRRALSAGPPESSAASAPRSQSKTTEGQPANGAGDGRPARRVASGDTNSSDVTAWLGHALSPPSEPVVLPSLDQVTGWSNADPSKPSHNADLALFGGWRIGDWKKTKTRGITNCTAPTELDIGKERFNYVHPL